jgi:hypothetical protein
MAHHRTKSRSTCYRAVLLVAGIIAIIWAPVGAAISSAYAAAPGQAQTSAQDCAVIAAVGEIKLKWHEQSPEMPMYAKSYGVDCDWPGLGIKHFDIPVLGPGPYYPGVRFSFSKPVYSPDGSEASVTYTSGGNAGPSRYFYSLSYCTVKNTGGGWQSAGCKAGPIT